MFGLSADEKYQHYLDWFAKEVSDPTKWEQMRNDRDCANYMTRDQDGNPLDPGKPIPLAFGEALFRMGNPKKMAKALDRKHIQQRAFVKEMNQYVGGNPANGLINPEYVKNMEALKKTQEEIKKSYSAYTTISPNQQNDMNEKNRESLEPQEQWKEMSVFAAIKHWFKGGKVESTEQEVTTWRKDEPKRK